MKKRYGIKSALPQRILYFSFFGIIIANGPVVFASKIFEEDDLKSSDDITRIYSIRFCPYCERVIIAAYKKGIQFEIFHINSQNRPDWFVRKQQEASVPVLEHKGKLVNDSRVIIEYLDETFPETSILSKEPYLRAKQRYYAIKLEPVCEAIKKMSYSTKLTGDITTLAKKLAMAEELLQSPFYSGETPSLPDIILFPFIRRLHVIRQFIRDSFLDSYFPNNYPKLVKWFIAMRNMSEVRTVQESEHRLRAFMISKAAKNTNSDTEVEPDLDNLLQESTGNFSTIY